ncbi:ABC transporter ATP-binding protein [Sphingomonas sp. LT1P40]|uniref:ABC transporter ATP-binding protein n=1 Tax=Alteristakelama amylovorans TaxID=3096166 RepID=UPI002FC5B42F
MVMLAAQGLGVALGGRPVLDGIDVSLAPSGLIGVIGPNGAGKSTLVRALTGLVPYQGIVTIDGADAAGITRAARARTMAYLPQGQILHWPLTVERLVGLGRLPHLRPLSRISGADADAIERAMARADVLHLRDRVATELSGGEKARALLARALAVEAPVLIADEPLAALDPLHQIEVMELLATEARGGALVIAVMHDLTMAARYCSRLLMLHHGRLVADGSPEAVLTPARLAEVYGVEARVELRGGVPVVLAIGRVQPSAGGAA